MEATIKNHPKFNRGERITIFRELPFNCYIVDGIKVVTRHYAHKNELYIPEMIKEDWNDIANGRD